MTGVGVRVGAGVCVGGGRVGLDLCLGAGVAEGSGWPVGVLEGGGGVKEAVAVRLAGVTGRQADKSNHNPVIKK